MEPGGRIPLGQRLLHQHVYHVPVFRVKADQSPVVRRPDHGFEDGVVVHHHRPAVCHEHLEAGDSLPNHLVHLRQAMVGEVLDDHVESVVYGSLTLGLLVPYIQSLGQGLAPLLNHEVHNAGSAAHCRRDGAGAEVV